MKSKTTRMSKTTTTTFCVLWMFVGAVSAYDNYLTIALQSTLEAHELNPICRWIMEHDDWNVARFVGLKTLGTVIVLCVLANLFIHFPKYAYPVLCSVAGFQALLLLVLTLDFVTIFTQAEPYFYSAGTYVEYALSNL